MQIDNSLNIKVKRLTETAKLPEYQSPASAGCDLHADISAPITIGAGERMLIPTGIAIEPASNNVGIFLFARSGLASKHGITLSNSVGVVDADYRGEIKLSLVNLSDVPYTLTPGERVAQLVVMPVIRATFSEADTLGDTQRGEGGFGHSGK